MFTLRFNSLPIAGVLFTLMLLLSACGPIGDPLDALDFIPLPTHTPDPGDIIMDALENPPTVEEGDQTHLDLAFELVAKSKSNCSDMLGGNAGRMDFCDETVYGLVYYRLEGSGNLRCMDFYGKTILETDVAEEAATLQFGVVHEHSDTFYYGNELLVSCTLTSEDGQSVSALVTQGAVDWDEATD